MRIDYEAALTRVLEREFPPPRMTDAKALLARYAADAPPSEGARVQLAILRLCGGDLDRLAHFVGRISEDYRDLRCWAEYPHTLPCQDYASENRRGTRHSGSGKSASTSAG